MTITEQRQTSSNLTKELAELEGGGEMRSLLVMRISVAVPEIGSYIVCIKF